jgi:hypothetical protein
MHHFHEIEARIALARFSTRRFLAIAAIRWKGAADND